MSKKGMSAREPSLAEALPTVIRNSGETVGEIADGSGVPRPVVSRFLDRTRPNIRIDTADRIMRHLGLTIRRK